MNIKFLVMDVDGTLTDGKIYLGAEREEFKAFNVKDGCGIHDILPQYNIIPVIITGRSSTIVENRCKELRINHLFQGVQKKAEQLKRFIEGDNLHNHTDYDLGRVAYIGDDLSDITCMREVLLAGGIVGCPADACEEVKKVATYVCIKNVGYGAVIEFIEFIITLD